MGISIRNYLRNPIKTVPKLYNKDFRRKLVVFVAKKEKKNSHVQEYFVVVGVVVVDVDAVAVAVAVVVVVVFVVAVVAAVVVVRR